MILAEIQINAFHINTRRSLDYVTIILWNFTKLKRSEFIARFQVGLNNDM